VLGPWLTTPDEIPDPGQLALSIKVNGETRQDAHTSDLILKVPELIAWGSSFYTLYPGDVLLTGTPQGVGPVRPGDVMLASIERIGSMRSRSHEQNSADHRGGELSAAKLADRPRQARLEGAAAAGAGDLAVEDAWLEEAQDDATLLAIRDMERAGIDIITDGEMRRESYSNRFATSLGGVDLRDPGTTINRSGARAMVPRIRGPIVRSRPIEVRDVQFLRANTDREIKITLPGRSPWRSRRRTTTTTTKRPSPSPMPTR